MSLGVEEEKRGNRVDEENKGNHEEHHQSGGPQLLVRHKLMPEEIDAAIVACLHIFAARGRAVQEAQENGETDCPDVTEIEDKQPVAKDKLCTTNENRDLRASNQDMGDE